MYDKLDIIFIIQHKKGFEIMGSTISKKGFKKIKTGINGLDTILDGGILPGRGLLIIGGPGTGKTIFLSEFLYRGITEFHQNGVFVTFEERPKYISQNMVSLGWDFDKFVKQKKLIFVDSGPGPYCEELSDCYDLYPLLERIKYAVKKVHAERVVIDGMGNLFQKFTNKKVIRDVVFAITDELKKMNITFMLSTEKSDNFQQTYSVEEYASDGVMELTKKNIQDISVRDIEIIKMRGASFLAGKVYFEITPHGVEIYPKFKLDWNIPYRKNNVKLKFGIPDFDDIINGGINEGSITVLAGSTGTGKTTLALNFLYEGLSKGQSALCLSFKDSIQTIEKMSDTFRWNFPKYIKEGKLKCITESQHPDKLIYEVTDMIKKNNIKRVVIDSLIFIDPTSIHTNKVTEFYITLIQWFKKNNITCIVTYLTLDNSLNESHSPFIALDAALRRVLTALPDNIIILRYRENEHIVYKQLHILKLHYHNHASNFYTYEIDKNGFKLNNEFVQPIELATQAEIK